MTLPPQPLSPLDGRYRASVGSLGDHLSEAGLNRARVHVEVEWLIAQTDRSAFGSTPLDDERKRALRAIVTDFGQDAIDELAGLEATTRHDVKAVEYYVRARLTDLGLDSIAELTHFACTSEDINNLSYAVTVKAAVTDVWLPAFDAVLAALSTWAHDARDVPMLAHTHGQPATPTTVGKEFAVFVHRLQRLRAQIVGTEYLGKFSGATGTFSAHVVADPSLDWPATSQAFVEGALGLTWNPSRRRSSRTTGRPSSTRASPTRTACCTTSPPTCGRTSRWATSPRSRRPGRPARRRCRTRSTRSGSRTPRPISSSPARCSTRWPRRSSPRVSSAT
nr:hypothetical protein GCM10025699_73390 [Microbacterium flavescens]